MAMSSSIRWRLVASYVLSSVATVAVAGVLAQSLVGRAVAERRAEDLAANAAAIAGRLGPRLGDPEPPVLLELARSAAFVADARVRILDAHENVLIDSGEPQEAMEMVFLGGDGAAAPWAHPAPVDGALIVRRFEGGLGPHRLTFDLGGEADALVELHEGLAAFHGSPTGAGTAAGDASRPRAPIVVWRSREVTATFAGSPVAARLAQDAAPAEPAAALPLPPPASLDAALRVPIGDPAAPSGFVEVSASDRATRQALATTRRAFSVAALAASLVAAALGLVVGRTMTRPLHNLTETARRMASDDLTARAEVRSRDEIGQLATQFNRMADRLGESFQALAEERDALRRFIADASHELRTPITALRAFVELLDGPAARDPGARAEFLAESQAQLTRLEWLTGQLLDLSRLDAGVGDIEREPLPVADLVQAVLGSLRPAAEARGVSLVAGEIPEGLTVLGDRPRLGTALANLVDNAIKFAPDGGGATVRVGAFLAGGGRVALQVADDGPGIAPEDLPRVFERFYRGRPAADDPGGSGLGLAIVRSVVRAHGGRIDVESALGAGSRFTLELPG